ncbi:hypothetical protein AVDCRST_MAG82-3247, partial [uncultured Rubrobacteraceae bacterium]
EQRERGANSWGGGRGRDGAGDGPRHRSPVL